MFAQHCHLSARRSIFRLIRDAKLYCTGLETCALPALHWRSAPAAAKMSKIINGRIKTTLIPRTRCKLTSDVSRIVSFLIQAPQMSQMLGNWITVSFLLHYFQSAPRTHSPAMAPLTPMTCCANSEGELPQMNQQLIKVAKHRHQQTAARLLKHFYFFVFG